MEEAGNGSTPSSPLNERKISDEDADVSRDSERPLEDAVLVSVSRKGESGSTMVFWCKAATVSRKLCFGDSARDDEERGGSSNGVTVAMGAVFTSPSSKCFSLLSSGSSPVDGKGRASSCL